MAVYYASSLVTSTAPTADDISNPGDLQTSLDTINAGDTLYILADGTYTPAVGAGYVFDRNGGTNTDGTATTGGFNIIGVNSSGVDDGTQPVIDTTNLTTGQIGLTVGASTGDVDRVYLKNLKITNSNGTPANGTGLLFIEANADVEGGIIDNIWVENQGSDGFDFQATSVGAGIKLINCHAYNNGQRGFECSSAFAQYINCSSRDNSQEGFDISGYGAVYLNCMAYNNGNEGWDMVGFGTNSTLINCISHNNTGDGINFRSWGSLTNILTDPLIFNCVITENGGFGISADSTTYKLASPGEIVKHCLFNNNTSGNIDSDTAITLDSTNIVDVDPGFVRTTGVPNFTPLPNSPLLNRGFPRKTY